MEVKDPQVDDLSFADDTILFTSGRSKTLQLIRHTLKNYEKTSVKLINSDERHYLVNSIVFNSTKDRIR